MKIQEGDHLACVDGKTMHKKGKKYTQETINKLFDEKKPFSLDVLPNEGLPANFRITKEGKVNTFVCSNEILQQFEYERAQRAKRSF